METFRVVAGCPSEGASFSVEASSAYTALTMLKVQLQYISMKLETTVEASPKLAEAHKRGEVSFIVTDENGDSLLCGEHRGQFLDRVSTELANSLRRYIKHGSCVAVLEPLAIPTGVDLDVELRKLLTSKQLVTPTPEELDVWVKNL